MTKKNSLKDQAKAYAKTQDQTKVSPGGGDFTPAAEGTTTARFIEYIELGMQPQKPYNGETRPPIPMAVFTFELLGSKWKREINGKMVADRITTRPMPITLSSKSNYRRLFDKMRNGDDNITHACQMIGDGFKVTVKHNIVEKDGKTTIYANLTDVDNNWLVGPPIKEETNEDGEVIGHKKLAVPEAVSKERLFLWEYPTKEQWASIFIDGEYEKKDGKGKVVKVSKNKWQELIQSALNFEGSPIQALLEGSDELPDDPDDLEDELEEDEIEEEEVEEIQEKPVAKKQVRRAANAAPKSTLSKSSSPAAKSTSASTATKTKSPSSKRAALDALLGDDE